MSQTLKDILTTLKPPDKQRLMYAFENSLTQTVIYAPGRFIGVNVNTLKNVVIEQSAGAWASGSIKESNVKT